MWPHFVNLLRDSGQNFLTALGTTGLGWWVQGIIWFFASEGATYAAVWVFRGKAAMRTRLGENFLIGLFAWMAVMICVYGPIFGWHVVKTIYDDHQALVSAAKKCAFTSESARRSTTWTERQVPSTRRGAKFETEFIAESSKTVYGGVWLDLRCDKELIDGAKEENEPDVRYPQAWEARVDPDDPNRKNFYYHFLERDPPFGVGHPLGIKLWSNAPIHCNKEITVVGHH